jgi:hypothetical protein
MSDDRIERRDAFGEPYELLTGAALRHELGTTWEPSAVAGVLSDSVLPTFTEEQAIEAALFFLKAAKVGIVGAAREMVAEQDAMATRNDYAYAEWVRALRGMPALQRALAELAKLEGGA